MDYTFVSINFVGMLKYFRYNENFFLIDFNKPRVIHGSLKVGLPREVVEAIGKDS